jgi:hypothetical protein
MSDEAPKRKKQSNPRWKDNLAKPWPAGVSGNPSGVTSGTKALQQVGALHETVASVVKQMNRFFNRIDKQIADIAANQIETMKELAALRTSKPEAAPEGTQRPMGGKEPLAAPVEPEELTAPRKPTEPPPVPPPPPRIQTESFIESGALACSVSDEEVMAEAKCLGWTGQVPADELNAIKIKLAGQPPRPDYRAACENSGATMSALRQRRWFTPVN